MNTQHFSENGRLYGGYLSRVEIRERTDRWKRLPNDIQVRDLPITVRPLNEDIWVRKSGIFVPEFKLVHLEVHDSPYGGGPHNVIVANGKQLNAQRLFASGGPPTQINTMAVGNSATAATSSDTQLAGATTYFQALDAVPTFTAGVGTATMTIGTGNGNFQHQEIGMFNGTVNGTSIMLDHIAPIGPFTKSSANTVAYSMTYTQG